jgi:hypothetical protein
MERTPWGLWQSTILSSLHNHPCDQSSPTSLMRCTQSSTIVTVEELVEMDVIPEMGVSVEFGVTTIDSSSTMFISAEEVNESMLDFLGTSSEIHELVVSLSLYVILKAYITTAGRTFNLKVLTVVLVESLQTTMSTAPIQVLR